MSPGRGSWRQAALLVSTEIQATVSRCEDAVEKLRRADSAQLLPCPDVAHLSRAGDSLPATATLTLVRSLPHTLAQRSGGPAPPSDQRARLRHRGEQGCRRELGVTVRRVRRSAGKAQRARSLASASPLLPQVVSNVPPHLWSHAFLLSEMQNCFFPDSSGSSLLSRNPALGQIASGHRLLSQCTEELAQRLKLICNEGGNTDGLATMAEFVEALQTGEAAPPGGGGGGLAGHAPAPALPPADAGAGVQGDVAGAEVGPRASPGHSRQQQQEQALEAGGGAQKQNRSGASDGSNVTEEELPKFGGSTQRSGGAHGSHQARAGEDDKRKALHGQEQGHPGAADAAGSSPERPADTAAGQRPAEQASKSGYETVLTPGEGANSSRSGGGGGSGAPCVLYS